LGYAGEALQSDADGKVYDATRPFVAGDVNLYVDLWGAGSGFTLGTYKITAVVGGWATLASSPGASKTGGSWHIGNNATATRDSYRLAIVPTGSETVRTWLTVFECAANTGAVHQATGFSGATYEGVEVDTWAVVFPTATTGFAAFPTYTVTAGSLRHLVMGLASGTGYDVACKTSGGSLVRTLNLVSSSAGTLDFTAGATEVLFTIGEAASYNPLVFEDVTDQTNLAALFAAWKAESDGLGKTWWPVALAAGDFTGSGRPDLVLSQHSNAGARILTHAGNDGNGIPQFADYTTARTLSGSFYSMGSEGSHYICDLNGDGYPDILSINNSGSGMALNDGTGQFAVTFNAQLKMSQLHLLDTTGTGRMDLVGFFPSFHNYTNDGDGTYTTTHDATNGEWMPFSETMRLSGMEGLLYPVCREVVMGGTIGTVVFVTFGDANGNTQLKSFAIQYTDGAWVDVSTALGLPQNSHVAGVFDFNNDGLPDLLLTDCATGGIYLNTGSALARQVDALSNDIAAVSGMVYRHSATYDGLADFDEDGLPEVLLMHARYGWDSRLYQNVNGLFNVRALEFYPPAYAFQFVVCDVDGDGHLDVVAMTTSGPRLYLNRTTPNGNWINVRVVGPAVNLVGIDAVVDVYTAGYLDNAAYLLASTRNNTAGSPPHLAITGIGHSHGGNLPIHVGLGTAASVDVRVTFPGGATVAALAQATDQTITLAVA
jgi:hypothetical protein